VTEMTAETRAFFAREDVRAYVAAVRAVAPDARFGMHIGNNCVQYWSSVRNGGGSPDMADLAVELIAGGHRGKLNVTYEDALREGRALIEEAELFGVDRYNGANQLTGLRVPAKKEPLPISKASLACIPRCDCGAEIFIQGPVKCGDCRAEKHKAIVRADLDRRISAAKVETPAGDVGPWSAEDAEYEL
jgi:hypothetical protein